MKKTAYLLGISIAAAALVDLSFPLRIATLSFAIAFVAFFFASYLFYQRIMERTLVNSILVLFFLFALMTFGYIVNTKAADKWTIIILCAVAGHVLGLVAKRKWALQAQH